LNQFPCREIFDAGTTASLKTTYAAEKAFEATDIGICPVEEINTKRSGFVG
jgi:hypothetical protein